MSSNLDRHSYDAAVGVLVESVVAGRAAIAALQAQEAEALASKAHQEAIQRFPHPIVTEITRAKEFWRAEDYHQRYLEKRGLASTELDPIDEPERARSAGQV